jgi:hypothetical protein
MKLITDDVEFSQEDKDEIRKRYDALAACFDEAVLFYGMRKQGEAVMYYADHYSGVKRIITVQTILISIINNIIDSSDIEVNVDKFMDILTETLKETRAKKSAEAKWKYNKEGKDGE